MYGLSKSKVFDNEILKSVFDEVKISGLGFNYIP